MSINTSLDDGWKPGAGAAGGSGQEWRCTGMAAGKAHTVLLFAPQAGQGKSVHWVLLRPEE